MNALTEAASATSQKVFLVASTARAAAKLICELARAAISAASFLRGSTSVKAAIRAKTMPGAPATMNATRQP